MVDFDLRSGEECDKGAGRTGIQSELIVVFAVASDMYPRSVFEDRREISPVLRKESGRWLKRLLSSEVEVWRWRGTRVFSEL